MADDAKEPQSPEDVPESLNHVVDDLAPKEQCADWILERMKTGHTPEAILAEMIDSGWDADEASMLVEFVRRETRRERGVVTREDIMRQANSRYRQSWSPSWFTGVPTVSSALRLINGMRNLATFNYFRKPRPPVD